MKNRIVCALGVVAALGMASSASANIEFDENVTGNVIYGTGNTNGFFTTDRANGVELGLRGKLRHNGSGAPENTFNSNGDGTYSFGAGVAPTQLFPTAEWSFDWSINSNYDGGAGVNLNGLRYELGLDSDASQGTFFNTFDPINDYNLANPGGYWDHAFGNNLTAQGAGVEATNGFPITLGMTADQIAAAHDGRTAAYGPLVAGNNLAQNSWKAHWYIPGFNPTLDGTYDIYLRAFDLDDNLMASTSIQIIVGQGGAVVPVPAAAPLGLLGMGLVAFVRRRKNAKA